MRSGEAQEVEADITSVVTARHRYRAANNDNHVSGGATVSSSDESEVDKGESS